MLNIQLGKSQNLMFNSLCYINRSNQFEVRTQLWLRQKKNMTLKTGW